MPLFRCDKCGCIDNTAAGGNYWHKHRGEGWVKVPVDQQKALCCECFTGAWHGRFPKIDATGAGYVQGEDEFWYKKEELEPGGYFHGRMKVKT